MEKKRKPLPWKETNYDRSLKRRGKAKKRIFVFGRRVEDMFWIQQVLSIRQKCSPTFIPYSQFKYIFFWKNTCSLIFFFNGNRVLIRSLFTWLPCVDITVMPWPFLEYNKPERRSGKTSVGVFWSRTRTSLDQHTHHSQKRTDPSSRPCTCAGFSLLQSRSLITNSLIFIATYWRFGYAWKSQTFLKIGDLCALVSRSRLYDNWTFGQQR